MNNGTGTQCLASATKTAVEKFADYAIRIEARANSFQIALVGISAAINEFNRHGGSPEMAPAVLLDILQRCENALDWRP